MCCHYSPEEQEGDLGNQNNFLLLATPDVGVDGEKVLHASLLKVIWAQLGLQIKKLNLVEFFRSWKLQLKI